MKKKIVDHWANQLNIDEPIFMIQVKRDKCAFLLMSQKRLSVIIQRKLKIGISQNSLFLEIRIYRYFYK